LKIKTTFKQNPGKKIKKLQTTYVFDFAYVFNSCDAYFHF